MNRSLQDAIEAARRLSLSQLKREVDSPVLSPVPAGKLEATLDLGIDPRGEPLEEVIDALEGVLGATTRTSSSRFFNQLFGGRTAPGLLGEIMASVLNSSMYTYKIAGPLAIIERRLIERMCGLVGFEHGAGTFVPGGSLSNMTAMILARNHVLDTCREYGVGARAMTCYTSELSHYSIPKSAGMIGTGRENVRRIGVDADDRMDAGRLREAIRADLDAGRLPFMICATAGLTVLGGFDAIEPLADVAEEFGVWLHVDGAMGGSVAVSPKLTHLIAGSHRADSFTWDAHKLMGVPMPCSVILTREPDVLRASLDEIADYLFHSDDDEFDLGKSSIQCGRRNDVLKLWCAWKHFGDEGYARRIEHLFALARHAANRVQREPSLRLLREPYSVTVCFEHTDVPAQLICGGLERRGLALVGHATVDGRTVVRLACVDADQNTDDIDAFFDAVIEVSQELSSTPLTVTPARRVRVSRET